VELEVELPAPPVTIEMVELEAPAPPEAPPLELETPAPPPELEAPAPPEVPAPPPDTLAVILPTQIVRCQRNN